jgi:hypothetical protein
MAGVTLGGRAHDRRTRCVVVLPVRTPARQDHAVRRTLIRPLLGSRHHCDANRNATDAMKSPEHCHADGALHTNCQPGRLSGGCSVDHERKLRNRIQAPTRGTDQVKTSTLGLYVVGIPYGRGCVSGPSPPAPSRSCHVRISQSAAHARRSLPSNPRAAFGSRCESNHDLHDQWAPSHSGSLGPA